MDRDYIILIVFVVVIFLLSMFVSYTIGIEMLPLIEPDFCYDSFAPGVCKNLWGFIELSAICFFIFYIVGKKDHERVRS